MVNVVSGAARPSGYPLFFNLLLIVAVPICFVASTLSLLMALPIGVLPYRLAAASLIALFPLALAYRASAALARRGMRGLLRAPIAILLILLAHAAIIGALAQWRGLQPPHLITAADHLHRVYLLGDTPPALEVIEPKPPLHELYDRLLANPTHEEGQILAATSDQPGLDGIEIWSTEGDFRARFLGLAARVERLSFLDEHRLLAVRATGRALVLDAERGELIHTLEPPELLAEVTVETSTRAAVIAGKAPGGELAIHYFDLETGAPGASLRSKTYVAFAVTSDLRRVLIVDRGKRGELVLMAHHLPSGELEATIPKATLVDTRNRRLKSVTGLVAIGGGEDAVIFDGTGAQLWSLKKKKASVFPLARTKIYPYAVAPGGHTYFHRRTDAGDPNPTGIYRLPGGEMLLELATRGQPPRAFFTGDGAAIAVGPALFSAEGKLIGGQMPESFTLERERSLVPARDGSAFVAPEGEDRLSVRNGKLSRIGAVPLRGAGGGAISSGGKLYAVSAKYPIDRVTTVLKELDEWKPTSQPR
jgi:hypothetical protein